MSGKEPRLLAEVSYYPDYMRFTIDELQSLFESFANIFKSIWESFKLLTATIKLNLKVVMGSWTGNKAMIDEAFNDFTISRRKYDENMAENLEYFKKYFIDSRIDNLGGFGPKVLAFAANPLLFIGTGTTTATIGRGSGTLQPYDVKNPIKSTFGVKPKPKLKLYYGDETSLNAEPTTSTSTATTTAATSVRISPRLDGALRFFDYKASRLSESTQVVSVTPEQQREITKLNAIAKSYVESERKNADELLGKISGFAKSLKEMLSAKNFDELTQAMKTAERGGMKLMTTGIQSAGKNIRAEFERQQEENPKVFKEAVKMMKQRAPDVKGKDDIETAMNFIFGVSKTRMQQQLIAVQEELLASARKTMNIPVDSDTREKLEKTEIGLEYLQIVDNFEESLVSGEREVETAKKSLKDLRS